MSRQKMNDPANIKLQKVLLPAENNETLAMVLLCTRESEDVCRAAAKMAASYLKRESGKIKGILLYAEGTGTGEQETIIRTISVKDGLRLQKLPVNPIGMLLSLDSVTEDIQNLDLLEACRILSRGEKLAVLDICSEKELSQDGELIAWRWMDAQWYVDVAYRCMDILKEAQEEWNGVPILLQVQILGILEVIFQENRGNKNKTVLKGAVLREFLDICSKVLWQIDNDLIQTRNDIIHMDRRGGVTVQTALIELKYRGKENMLLDPAAGCIPAVTLDLMEYDGEGWRADFSVNHLPEKSDAENGSRYFVWRVKRDSKEVPFQRTAVYAGESFFGEQLAQKDTFFIKIPYTDLRPMEKLEFYLSDGNTEVLLPITTVDYESKLTRKLEHSYWCFRDYMVTFGSGDGNRENGDDAGYGAEAKARKKDEKEQNAEDRTDVTQICIKRAGRFARMAREAKLLREILRAPYGSKRMFTVRMMYWLSYPVYGRKKIWLTFDKLYKGGDCGEYFYRYMVTRKKDGITPGYIIRSDAKDLERLRREGYEPLIYQSMKQRLMYLHASMIFATHSSVHGFCGFSKWEIRFVQDRLRAVNTCIQHGLSVQDLRADSNRIVNNNKRYYCASPCEVENLSKPEYDYGKDVLRLTGLARYDGLVNRDKKQVLITPTCRAYIAMPPVMGSARPYNPDFIHTDYYRIFQELLDDERLAETAEKNGYEVIYLLHPVISAQKKDFHVRKGIRLLEATEISYEQVLTESSLMVTDYSGVQFDFAYMRKPVVYFHPPKLPPHYEEGGFNYETQGFGEICTETEELVRTLCEYMETGCALKSEYRKRQDAFFAFDDHENCRRIFEDALEYMESRK